MAMSSLIQTATIRDSFKNAIALNFGGTSPDVIKIALFKQACTPAQDTDPATYGSAPYNANEVTGTGWTAAQTLAGPSCTLAAGVGVMLDATDVSVTGTSLGAAGAGNGVYGCAIYDDTLSPKCVIMAISFGADYVTNNGTFAITWDGNGLARLTLHP